MTDPMREHQNSAAALDAHLADCPSCSVGVACPVGDDTAEREFRAWRALDSDDAAPLRREARQ